MDMVYHKPSLNSFCKFWKEMYGQSGQVLISRERGRNLARINETPLTPSATSYVAYLYRIKKADSLYKFANVLIHGSVPVFVRPDNTVDPGENWVLYKPMNDTSLVESPQDTAAENKRNLSQKERRLGQDCDPAVPAVKDPWDISGKFGKPPKGDTWAGCAAAKKVSEDCQTKSIPLTLTTGGLFAKEDSPPHCGHKGATLETTKYGGGSVGFEWEVGDAEIGGDVDWSGGSTRGYTWPGNVYPEHNPDGVEECGTCIAWYMQTKMCYQKWTYGKHVMIGYGGYYSSDCFDNQKVLKAKDRYGPSMSTPCNRPGPC